MSTSINLQEVLELAIATNNQELVNFVTSKMAESVEPEKKPRGRGRPKKIILPETTTAAPKKNSRIVDVGQFKTKGKNKKQGRATPVQWAGNTWEDDGVTEKNELNITPSVTPVKRNREKYTKVDIICKDCKERVQIDQRHARENFVCDDCIDQKRRRGARTR
jgi:hypothetical protein